jgi:hypothetical protein
MDRIFGSRVPPVTAWPERAMLMADEHREVMQHLERRCGPRLVQAFVKVSTMIINGLFG